MTATATLPIWVLLLFFIAFTGFVTLIYTRGNWQTTLLFVGLATFTVLAISGINAWSAYIKTHFVGRFDQLGIPFREAGPGWTLLPATWPLWLVPAGLLSAICAGIVWWLHAASDHSAPIAATKPQEKQETTVPILTAPEAVPILSHTKTLAQRLEVESLKQELATTKEKLATAIEIAEEQVDKNQDLEIKLSQLEEEHTENITELQDRIAALELEIAAKEAQSDELTALALQQAEEIARLKNNLEAR